VVGWGVEQALVRRHQGAFARGAAHLHVAARVVHEDGFGQCHPPGLMHAALQLGEQHGFVDADEEVGQVALEVVGRVAPVGRGAAHLALQPLGGIQRAPAWDAGAAVCREAGVKARRDLVVEQVMHDAVAKACCPHLARLGVGDDEAHAAAGLVGAGAQFVVQLPKVVLGLGLEGHRTGAVALVAAAVEPGLHEQLEQVRICGGQRLNPQSSCGCCSGCRC